MKKITTPLLLLTLGSTAATFGQSTFVIDEGYPEMHPPITLTNVPLVGSQDFTGDFAIGIDFKGLGTTRPTGFVTTYDTVVKPRGNDIFVAFFEPQNQDQEGFLSVDTPRESGFSFYLPSDEPDVATSPVEEGKDVAKISSISFFDTPETLDLSTLPEQAWSSRPGTFATIGESIDFAFRFGNPSSSEDTSFAAPEFQYGWVTVTPGSVTANQVRLAQPVTTAVPEPSSSLALAGLLGLGLLARRR